MLRTVVGLLFVLVCAVALGHGDAAVIDSVLSGGPAQAAGLRAGDKIVKVGDLPLATRSDLDRLSATYEAGQTVPVVVERDGETVELELTFGERPDGGPSIGVGLQLVAEGSGEGTEKCLAWIEAKYKISSLNQELQLDHAEDYANIKQCVARDAAYFSTEDAVRYCDNIFKVHCSAVDLITEFGESQIELCATQLQAILGVPPDRYAGWRTCAESKVFDAYSLSGELATLDTCKAALFDECGTNLDAQVDAGTLSAAQETFVECCAAPALDGDRCAMLGDGFARGPCLDHAVCVNADSTEWLTCSK